MHKHGQPNLPLRATSATAGKLSHRTMLLEVGKHQFHRLTPESVECFRLCRPHPRSVGLDHGTFRTTSTRVRVPADKMTRQLSRWGVGPPIAVSMLLAALLACVATRLWPEVCIVRAIPRYVAIPCGAVLLAVGLSIWPLAVMTVMRAYRDDRLATTSVFGLPAQSGLFGVDCVQPSRHRHALPIVAPVAAVGRRLYAFQEAHPPGESVS